MTTQIRRVVVGVDGAGATAVLADGPAPTVVELPAVPGTSLVDLWRSDEVPVVPTGEDPTLAPFALMPAGTLFRVIDLAPTGDAEPMWHRTDSVDFIYIAAGSCSLLFRGGRVELTAGDAIVVQAVEHAWINDGPGTCRIVDGSVAATT